VKNTRWIILIISIAVARIGECQSTVFSALQDSKKLADKNYAEGNFTAAAELYRSLVANGSSGDPLIRLKLARAYYQIKKYRQSVLQYDSYIGDGGIMPSGDLYIYAEVQASLKNYVVAIDFYKQFRKMEPDNELVAKKIWRLDNIHYLYEDSSTYATRQLNINTPLGEMCPVAYGNGIVFTSNRRTVKAVQEVNAKLNTPFYQLYSSFWKKDSTMQWGSVLGKPVPFAGTIKSRFNTGPVAFYNNGKQMVFVASSEKSEQNGQSTLGLYFASLEGNQWKITSSFPHNGAAFSIRDVTISEDGKQLFFSSEMKGGFGGSDIYSSKWSDSRWSKPSNLGEVINTSKDEVFPYLHMDGNLYFSSNGQAGVGQLDIFKSEIKAEGFSEPENVGYPINSGFDDFGLSLDSAGARGYFTSNRKNGGYDDDIYEFDMDLQSYPITITGVIKFQEYTFSNETTIQKWPNVQLSVIDSWRGKSVFRGTTDGDGNFSITIPYFSKFFLQILDEDGINHKVSLEMEKYRKEASSHDIVVVKDIFTQHERQKH
jgi:tetratricopeptide (TPR) repeat protein